MSMIEGEVKKENRLFHPAHFLFFSKYMTDVQNKDRGELIKTIEMF
jgi:hypothetical protein